MEEIEVPVGKVYIFRCLQLWKNISFIEISYLWTRLRQRELMSFCDCIFDHIHTLNSTPFITDAGACKAVKCCFCGGGFTYK